MEVVEIVRGTFTNLCKFRALKDLVEEVLERLLPENAHKLCSNRLGLSLTRIWSFENNFVSDFETRQVLIDAISAGCFIPFWSGSLVAPRFRDESYIDGAYSDNKPKFKTNNQNPNIQLNLSPFSGESLEVSPRETLGTLWKVMGVYHHVTWKNAIRSVHAMFPVSISHYKLYLLEGHRDMKDYLLGHNLIRCRRCHLLLQSSVASIQNSDKINSSNPIQAKAKDASACLICLLLLEKVDSLEIPDKLTRIFDH